VEEPLVPPGNALRPRSLSYIAVGFCALVVLTASDAHFALSVPLGILAVAIAAFGALDFTGCFDDAQPAQLGSRSLASLAPRLLETGGAAVLWVGALRLAVAGVLPHLAWLAPLLVTLTSLGGALALARLVSAWAPSATPCWSRPGLCLVLLGVGLYVPLLGCYSLLDPWEAHFGEVTREMLARDDWLSLWWAQERWFFSKPVLDFWLQGLFFALLGVKFRPDEMLAGAAHGYLPQPEWAARMPVVLLTLGSVYALYRFVAKAAGRRVGFLSGLVLLCAPYWALLSHQSMTDMPYVAPLTAAMALFGLGLLADADELAPALSVTVFGRTLTLSAFHALFGLVLVSALPQLAYLVSRNLTLQVAAPPYGFRWHLDELFAGSGLGNCGLPGNDPCRRQEPANPLFQPLLGALIFGSALVYLLFMNRGERRKKRLFYLAAWYFTALSALAKGAPGLVLPVVVAGAVLVARRDWLELTRVELASFCLMFAAVCLPWYVQEFMRHGEPFTDRLLFHDMYDRAFVHVHDTNSGTDVSLRYYIWQLGYGLFPWTGLAPLGLGMALGRHDGTAGRDDSGDEGRRFRELALLMVLWCVVAFALFTISLTKFHHYALPCTPPLAVGAALVLDRALGERSLPGGWRRFAYLAGLGVAALLLVHGAMRLRDGTLFGRVLADGMPPDGAPLQGCAFAALGLLLTWFVARLWAPAASKPNGDSALGVLALTAALVTLLVARDLSTSVSSDVPASARLLHLVTYNYKRSWPASLDFEAVQWGFGVAAALCLLLWLVPKFRLHAGVLLGAIGVWFCAFTLWIYLPLLAPHYGQRELLLTYYQKRHGPEEPIVAYQMNWKGENFYTGNRLPAFVSTGAKFKSWLKAQRKNGTKVIYFVTEHGRIGTLKGELGVGFRSVALTDQRLNNKFALVRTELTTEPASANANANDSDNASE
jgi:4-amino-4-deoxy-L-arabinose transferase-like glycosyltransferase